MGSQGNENPTIWMFDEYNLMEDISVTSLLDPIGVFASTTWPSPPHLSFSNPTSLRWSLIPFLLFLFYFIFFYLLFFSCLITYLPII